MNISYWNAESYQQFQIYLRGLEDIRYRDFIKKLIPQVDNIIGIRMPILRSIAKDIAKQNFMEFLRFSKKDSYEEIMIQGLVIGMVKVDYPQFIQLYNTFINKLDNWGTCDSFCAGLKRCKNYPEFFNELKNNCSSSNPWIIRASVVTMLFHFIDEIHIEDILNGCNKIESEDYYVKMAIAWLISICYIKYPDITNKYLVEGNSLDTWTFNKAIQKIRESKRVSLPVKAELNKLKRS